MHRTVRGISFIFVGIDAAGDVFSLVSVCTSFFPLSSFSSFLSSPLFVSSFLPLLLSCSPAHRAGKLTQAGFHRELDILGMAIYASEFVLWCGVFAAGGYFNLRPWLAQRLKARREERGEVVADGGMGSGDGDGGASNDIQIHRAPSSTSVFRTPSSIVGSGASVRLEIAG